VLQLVLIIFVTPATFSTAISGERQRQTLDLLLVTRLSSLGITLGKLIAAVSFDLLLLVCSLPIFSLVFLFGGVGPDHVVEVFLLLVMIVLCFGSMGMLVSALSRRSNASTVVTYLLVLLLIPGLALVTIYLTALGYTVGSGTSPLPFTAYIDPGFGLFTVLLNPDDGSPALGFPFAVWEATMLVSAVTTVVCVALCAALLRRQRA
jgi:ABC-2 type transport system permease protein